MVAVIVTREFFVRWPVASAVALHLGFVALTTQVSGP